MIFNTAIDYAIAPIVSAPIGEFTKKVEGEKNPTEIVNKYMKKNVHDENYNKTSETLPEFKKSAFRFIFILLIFFELFRDFFNSDL